MKRLLTALAILAATCGAKAEVIETLTMRDGNVYSGYISEQMSNGEICFRADTSVVYLPMYKIDRIVNHRRPMTRKAGEKASGTAPSSQTADIYLLPVMTDTVEVEIVAVADTAVAAGYESEEAYAEVADEERGEVIRDVEILEEGSVVKYRDCTPRDLRLRMQDVRLSTRAPRDPSLANGLADEVVTRNGQTYTGQIVSNEPGKSLRINSDGRIYIIAFKDIAVQRRVPIDSEEPVIKQAPLLDNIYLRKGGEVLRDVVLTEQNFAEGYFNVTDRNNVTIRRDLRDISRIQKKVNREYAPRRIFNFDKDSVYINRTAVDAQPYQRKDELITAKLPEGEIPVFMRDHGHITVECSDNMSNRRMLLVPVIMRETKNLTLNIGDLIEKNVPASTQEINPKNNILSRNYYLGAGCYALINTDDTTMIIFRVR